MLEHVRQLVSSIETDLTATTREAVLARLRPLAMEAFGQVLWSMPNPAFPRLSGLLPRMATEEVQRNWTGNAGDVLLNQSAQFVRSVAYNYGEITGRPLSQARILDYGCGYGRIARLMYKFVDEERVVGVDPWSESIRICAADKLRNCFLSEYLPKALPTTGKFQLIYAFSVFTHLSKRATLQAMSTLRRYVHDGGVLVITIRPVEYWIEQHPEERSGPKQRDHQQHGFAFWPHDLPPVEGDVTYGDTSMTTEWLLKNCPEWNLVAEDWSLADVMQRYLFLTPKLA